MRIVSLSPDAGPVPTSIFPAEPKFSCEGLRFVNPDPFPLKLPVMVPAEKFPDASRFTIVLAVFALVAALAALAPLATFAADCPPTATTVVAP